MHISLAIVIRLPGYTYHGDTHITGYSDMCAEIHISPDTHITSYSDTFAEVHISGGYTYH